MDGFIKLPRSWLTPRIIKEHDFLKAAVYLAEKIADNGSVDFSSGDAFMLFGMSPRRYRTFMSLIVNDKQNDKQATSKTTNKTTNIKFEYQVVASDSRQAKRQAKRQTSDKQNDKQNPTKFTPPTDEEVKSYVLEKGYHFNPEQFIPHYQSKGWMVGRNPMKDWRAACQTWEIEWKKKHGEQFYYQTNAPKQTYAPRNLADSRAAERADLDIRLREALDAISSVQD